MLSIKKHLSLIVCAMVLAASIDAISAEVTVSVSPKQISVGEASVLKVRVSDAESVSQPTLPDVKGLKFAGSGRSQNTTWVNGTVTANIDFTYYIVPDAAGDYTIPSFEVKADGESFTTEPQRLKVLKTSSAAQSKGASEDASTSSSQYAFLRVTPLAKEVYVGQYIPVRIDAYFSNRHRMSLTSNPSLTSSAFTFNKMSDEPDQSRKSYQGQTYTVVSWFAGITPVKAGEYEFGIKLGASVQVRVQNSRKRPRSRSLFDSFFDDPFSHRVVERKIDIKSASRKVKVLSLPDKNKPETFSGAIGQFKIAASTSTDEVMVGDPITMKIIISGEGNFDRINIPVLSNTEQWKSYKANSTFTAGDVIGYEGKKIFEQALIPQDERAEAIPNFNFTYFDTKKGRYVTVKTPEIPLSIIRADDEPRRYVQVDSVDEENEEGDDQEKQTTTDEDGLAPISVELRGITPLIPIWNQRWFQVLNAISIAFILLGYIVYHKRINGKVDKTRKVRKQLSKQVVNAVKEVDMALKNRNTIAFFDNCRKAIQIHIAHELNVTAETVTVTEIEKACGSNRNKLVELFDMADAVKYSGHTLDAAQMKEWREVLEHEIRELEV